MLALTSSPWLTDTAFVLPFHRPLAPKGTARAIYGSPSVPSTRPIFGGWVPTDEPEGIMPDSGSQSYPPTSSADTQHRILVVEDEAVVALDIMATLRQMGYCVI